MGIRLRGDDLPPPKVGDRVTTDFESRGRSVVRTVTAVKRGEGCESGLLAEADAGEPCGECGRHFAEPTGWIDSNWFLPAEAAQKGKRKARP